MVRWKPLPALIAAFTILLACSYATGQDFPYAAPRAPEFDDLGNVLSAGQPETSTPRRTKQSYPRQERSYTPPQAEYGRVKPYVPRDMNSAPPAVQHVRPPQYAPNYGPQQPMAPRASAPPSRPPAQIQGRPDCSQFPMMIARARSEPEMQITARQYLTCLLKNGWHMEQARAQVISTIESTFRLAR